MAASLSDIYGRLNGVAPYHPLSADTYADWAMEAGDIVTVKQGDDSYVSPVHSSTLRWNGKQRISINSDGKKERDPISKVSQQKYNQGRGGGGGYGNNQDLYWEMFSEDGTLHATISATASELRTEYTANGSELYSVIQQTATNFLVELGNTASGLYGTIEATASEMRVEYSAANSTLYSVVQQTATNWYVELGNTKSGLYGNIEATASRLRSEYSAANSTLYSVVQQTATNWYVELGNAESEIAGRFEVVINDLGQVEARVESIVTDYLKTDELESHISRIANLDVISLYVINDVDADTLSADSDIILDGTSLGNAYVSLTDGNYVNNSKTVTFTKANGGTDTITFSRATTLSGTYGGSNAGDTATYTVAASPQGNTLTGSFTVKQSKAAAYVIDPSGVIRARIDNPQYGNGWTAAAGNVSWPGTNTSSKNATFKAPSSTVDGTQVSKTYYMDIVSSGYSSSTKAYLRNPDDIAVAALDVGPVYTAGVRDGEDEFSSTPVLVANSSSKQVFKYHSSSDTPTSGWWEAVSSGSGSLYRTYYTASYKTYYTKDS